MATCWYCVMTSRYKVPTVKTSAVTNILTNGATCGGNVTSNGGLAITARGVCYSTSSYPTTSNSKTSNGTGTGVFTSSLTGLLSNKKYYVRAYATNSKGTSYGSQVSFTTLATTTTTTSSSTTTSTTSTTSSSTTTTTSTSSTTTTSTTTLPPTTTTTTTVSGELIFHSGFENNTVITTNPKGVQYNDFSGTDNSVSSPNNWVSDLQSGPEITMCEILTGSEYIGTPPMIVADPHNPSNKVLTYSGIYPNENLTRLPSDTDITYFYKRKFRMQTEMYSNAGGFSNLYYRVKMMLPNDFEVMQNIYYTITWFTFAEFWNESSGANMFRITLTIAKLNTGTDNLKFRLTTEKYTGSAFVPVLTKNNLDFIIPLDVWMDMEVHIIEGNASTGKIYFAVTPENGAKQVIFNETTFTHHPNMSPNGITYFQPMKLYTYGYIADAFRNAGKVMQLFWDDFEIRRNRIM